MAYKMKTKSGAAKRFKVTAGGHVKFKRTKMRHILAKKRHKNKRLARRPGMLSPADEKTVRRLLINK